MNIDRMLEAMNRCAVDYLLIGGVSFLLRHKPVLTFDVDFWIEPSPENRLRCERALCDLESEWGRRDEEWGSVAKRNQGWLDGQSVFCLHSPHGAIDIFLSVKGLDSWATSFERSLGGVTSGRVAFRQLCDGDMLACQLALNELKRLEEAKRDRCWEPAARWKALQETIAWAERQSSVRRNEKANRLAEQRRKLQQA